MLQLSNAYTDRAILSLQTGGQIGQTTGIIMNPNNLKIEGWHVSQFQEKGTHILPTVEVREFIVKGLVVNDHHAITHKDDLVRIQNIIAIKFQLHGKQVMTESKKRLGRVADFAVDEEFYVQKLYVNPSIMRGLPTQQTIIDRGDIVEITNKRIVVRDATVRAQSGSPARVPAG